jgi:EAL domain-containing protein (putative c-di-GMP-specific phosphodiesterase class I)
MPVSKRVVQNIDNFRKYGFRIAIDDLGPNFEIVSDMGKIPAGIVKITRNNVLHIMDDGENVELIKRVLKAAKDKSKLVVAEGLENEEMIKKIYDLEIRFMQGYFFNQPKSVIEIEKMIMKSPWNMNSFQDIIE